MTPTHTLELPPPHNTTKLAGIVLSIQYSAFELRQASGSMVLQQDGADSSEQQVILSALPDVRIIEGKPYVSRCCVAVYQVVLLVTVHVGGRKAPVWALAKMTVWRDVWDVTDWCEICHAEKIRCALQCSCEDRTASGGA